MPAASTTTTPILPTTEEDTTMVDYGDQIPINFMDVNYDFAVVVMVGLAFAAALGTFGNILILVTVATHRHLRSVESIFIVNLACCDLYVTMFAEPLSIIAKTIGWRWFEGVPGLCRSIGYLCTLSCVGSLMTLSIMSLNRYVLICHYTMYAKIFTARNCLFFCFLIYVLGVLLISFNWYGIGDHSFDYKSYECVWDRMASHDYTIVFSIVLVWVPITITGLAYGRTYWYVKKVRTIIARKKRAARSGESSRFSPNNESKMAKSSLSIPENADPVYNAYLSEESKQLKDDQLKTKTYTIPSVDESLKEDAVNVQQIESFNSGEVNSGSRSNLLQVPSPEKKGNRKNNNNRSPSTPVVKFNIAESSRAQTTEEGCLEVSAADPKDAATPASSKPLTSSHPGMKLARPLFIIYVVFSTCWIPYSLVIIFDSSNSFPHELHAFITAFAHFNSSINWLVYYHTHMKMRHAFRRLLGLRPQRSAGSVQPLTTNYSERSDVPVRGY